MSLDADTGYAIKRVLQNEINLATQLETAAKALQAAADLLRADALQVNTDLALPDFGSPPVPTPDPAPAQIATRYGPCPPDVSAAIMAAWPAELWTAAAEISFNESSWNPKARANTLDKGSCGTQYALPDGRPALTEDSVGCWQINRCVWGGTVEELEDPEFNAKLAYRIYRQQGWAAWQYSAQKLGLV